MKNTYEPWTFDEALNFIKELEKYLEVAGYHVGMAGSVLHEGKSLNDLDLILFPHNASSVNLMFVFGALEAAGLSLVTGRAGVAKAWEKQESDDTKHVEVWTWHDKRVDLFFLR